MRKSTFGLMLIFVLSLLFLILNQVEFLETSGLATQIFVLQHKLFLKRLTKNHTFFSASRQEFQFFGRWTSVRSGTRKDASFSGSRVQFKIKNSTTLFLALRNAPLHSTHDTRATREYTHHYSLVKPFARDSAVPLPVSIMISVGSTDWYHSPNAHGTFLVCEGLASNSTYKVTIELLQSAFMALETLQFEGVWLSKYAELIAEEQFTQSIVQNTLEPSDEEKVMNDQYNTALGAVEIVAPLDTALFTTTNTSRHASSLSQYPRLLEQSEFFRVTVTTIPIPPSLCLTPSCHPKHNNKPTHPTIPDLYFRSGPWGTTLYHYPWSWSHARPFIQNPKPSALILAIGLSDFQTFFDKAPKPPNQKELDAFTNSFITAYIKFILTIRRTTWQQRGEQTSQHQDQSYLYNSAPSTLPIFLMVPIVPPSSPQFLSKILHNAIQRIITTLQKTEGDTRTFMIDTSGWFDDSNFIHTTLNSFKQPQPQPQPQTSPTKINTTFTISNLAHQKIAQYLSLHLCPHLPPKQQNTQNPKCPFKNQHKPYHGNLYLPDQIEVNRIIEEGKIERVKRGLGWAV